MTRFILRSTAALIVAVLVLPVCGGATQSPRPGSAARGDLGVDAAGLSPVIDNPYVAFALVKRAVYEGKELEAGTGKTVKVRVVAIVRDKPETVAGVKVTVIEVSDFDDGELAEKTLDYYAQDRSGAVYYIGERVDDLEGGKVIGHGGQWMAGEKNARAGVFMPATPMVGDVFDQERAPGVAQDRSTVIRTGLTVTVPAGICKDCIETEDFDPIKKTSQRKIYCRGTGLVRELARTQSLELIEFELRSSPSSPSPR